MEIYILDSLLRRSEVLDVFESAIWTERFSAAGDFELVVKSDRRAKTLLKEGTRLAANVSDRVMTVETVEDTTDEENRKVIRASGPSIEALMKDRVIHDGLTDLTSNPTWTIGGTPGGVARGIFDEICRQGVLDPADIIPFLAANGYMYPQGTIPYPSGNHTIVSGPDTVYNKVKEVCDQYDLGFRLTRHPELNQLYWDVYTGNDRTTQQQTLAPVVFAPDMQNLENTNELTTIEQTKNVAYVFSPAGFKMVYGQLVDPETEGFERRVLLVKADDVTTENYPTAAEVDTALTQIGNRELAKNRSFKMFDGEINHYGGYRYMVDYMLGDLVEFRSPTGETTVMRVTEQIFAADSEGERSYPTLSMHLFVNAGTWLDRTYMRMWEEMGLTEYWDNAP